MSVRQAEKVGPICDASLAGLNWERDGLDLVVQLSLGAGTTRLFTFTWVDGLPVSIRQQPNGPAQPLSWNTNAERLTDGRVRVLLDIAHQRAITFECNDIITREADGRAAGQRRGGRGSPRLAASV